MGAATEARLGVEGRNTNNVKTKFHSRAMQSLCFNTDIYIPNNFNYLAAIFKQFTAVFNYYKNNIFLAPSVERITSLFRAALAVS